MVLGQLVFAQIPFASPGVEIEEFLWYEKCPAISLWSDINSDSADWGINSLPLVVYDELENSLDTWSVSSDTSDIFGLKSAGPANWDLTSSSDSWQISQSVESSWNQTNLSSESWTSGSKQDSTWSEESESSDSWNTLEVEESTIKRCQNAR